MTASTVSTVSVTDARTMFSDIVDEVTSVGSTWTITKHGRPVAVILGHDEYESLIETVNILSDGDAMAAIAEASDEVAIAVTDRA